jgi:hypothetical protein
MVQATIDLDVYSSLEPEGVNTCVFICESGDPACEMNFELTDLISSVYEMYCVPSGPIVCDTDHDGVQEILSVVDQMRNAADDLEERVRSGKILLRDKWVADNGPNNFGASTNKYQVSYSEYLDHLMQNQRSENE